MVSDPPLMAFQCDTTEGTMRSTVALGEVEVIVWKQISRERRSLQSSHNRYSSNFRGLSAPSLPLESVSQAHKPNLVPSCRYNLKHHGSPVKGGCQSEPTHLYVRKQNMVRK